MTLGWQDGIALGIVFAAVTYLGSLSWNAVVGKRGGRCGTGCGGCSIASRSGVRANEPKEVVTIGPLREPTSGVRQS